MIELKKETERVILVGVCLPGQEDIDASLEELSELAKTAGAVTVGKVVQSRDQVHPGTYVGKGKIDEIKSLLWELDATEETVSATISAQLQQLPKTAYQFRFTLAGSSETERIRCTVQTDTDTKTYALEQGRYQSDSRKNADGTLLRTFSLPITSGTDGKVSIQFTVKQACMQILPVQPDAVLQALPAYSYQEWKQDASRAANPIVDLSNAKLPKSALLQILATCGANTTISLENADIYNDME